MRFISICFVGAASLVLACGSQSVRPPSDGGEENDAGTLGDHPDASIDSGAPEDGGEDGGAIDAGEFDGGEDDAGEIWRCSDGADASVIVGAATDPLGSFMWTEYNSGYVVTSGLSRGGPATIQLLDRHFAPVAAPVSLPGVGPTYPSLMSEFGDSLIAAWSSYPPDSGIELMRIARVETDGGFSFSVNGDGGVPGVIEISLPVHASASGPRPIVAPDRSCVLIVWNDSCAGFSWSGMTVLADGTIRASPRGLVPLPFGPDCGIFGGASFLPWGDSGFLAAQAWLPSDGGTNSATFTELDCDLNWSSSREWLLPSDAGRVMVAQNARRSAEGPDELWANVLGFFGPNPFRAIRLLPDGGLGPEIRAPGADRVVTGSVLHGTNGTFAAWSSQTVDGGFLISAARNSSQVTRLTYSEPSGPYPIALPADDGMFAVGTIISAGDGGYLRRIQTFCEP